MPPLSESVALVYQHLGLGLVAALLFAAGLATSVAIVRGDVRWMMALPLWLVRRVLRVIGPDFPTVRVFLVIFCFNSVAIFLYMASGVLVVLPGLVAFLTGVNIGVIVLKAPELEVPGADRRLADAVHAADDADVPQWVSLCSFAVLVLELPSFWLSVGMGIGMGRELTRVGQYTLANMEALLADRTAAYLMLVVPVLFLSALAETAAIRGHVRARPTSPSDDDGQAPS